MAQAGRGMTLSW